MMRREMTSVPIIGHVAAGEPLLAEQNIEDYFPIPVEMLPNANTFLLKVQGESMVNAGILNGDLVLVKEQMCIRDSLKTELRKGCGRLCKRTWR